MNTDDEDLDLNAEAPGDWIHLGACQGHDAALFFPERESAAPAKAICKSCAVQQECLEYALRTAQKFGIWGGRSERERRRMRFGINGGRAA